MARNPQSHGKIERANRTLEQMLKKFISEQPRQWDLILPLLCFAIRELPSETTHFSSFELVYGRKVRDLLTLAREEFEGADKTDETLKIPAAKYVNDLQDRIRAVLDAAAINTRVVQDRNKRYFDKRLTARRLELGDKALILMPSSSNKLLAKCCGPYRVIRKGTDNNLC